MDALQGRPKVDQIKSVEELHQLTLATRELLLEAYAEGTTQRVIGAWIWLRDHGNRWPMLNGATDFEPHRLADQFNPQRQDFIATANAILSWTESRINSAEKKVLRLMERVQDWKSVAADQIDDIGGWRTVTDNPPADPADHIYERIISKRGWMKPKQFYSETTALVGCITTDYPKLDPTPLQDIYSAVAMWHEDQNARNIPSQSQLMVTLDRAMMVLQAMERDCELRLIGSKKIPSSFGKKQDKASADYSGLITEINSTSKAERQPVPQVVEPLTTSQLFQSLLTRFQQGHARHGQSMFGLRLMTDLEIEVAQRDCPQCVLEVDGFLSFDHPDFEEPLKVVAFAHCAGNAPVELLSNMLDRCIEAWEDFKPLSREAGSHLPAKFRKAMPIEPHDPSGIWYTFLLWCQTLEKEQFMNEPKGLRPLSISPFLDSVDAIEICELVDGKAILPPKLSTAIPSGQGQQFAKLSEWARENLKGKQLRVLEMVVAGNGTKKIEEIATDKQIGWDEPYEPLWNSARQALNGKLRRLDPKWVLNTRNGSALLTKIEQK